MRQLLPILFFFCGFLSFGQSSMLSNAFSWFNQTETAQIKTYLESTGYRLKQEQFEANSHHITYSPVKTENGTEPKVSVFLNDSTLGLVCFETYEHKEQQSILAQLKSKKFKQLSTEINGDFIRTSYDNSVFIVQEDYQAVQNPLGKGEIPLYVYRIYRKYSSYDSMNGERVTALPDGTIILRENYKNGALDGLRTLYSPNGTMTRTENYRAGRLNGIANDYNEEGKIIHSSTHSYHWKYGMEKWYNREGKLVKSLQWQRDLPVGTEKQTFDGKMVGSVPYVKGVKQGLAKVPVYFDPYTETHYPLDTLNDEPIGIETVLYENGVKTGKAVCVYFSEPDTLYVAYYKSGKLDSTFTRYAQDGILYTTDFTDGLENGKRVFRIPSGSLKDTIYRVENYQNGKLHGLVSHYYRKEADQLFTDPDPGFHVDGRNSGTTTVPGQWKKILWEENYSHGVRNGSFIYVDSVNENSEFYVNGKLDGQQVYRFNSGGKKMKIVRNFEHGARTGKWETEHISDTILVTEHYKNDQKQGDETRTVRGKLIEKRYFHNGILVHLKSFGAHGDYNSFDSESTESPDSVLIAHARKDGDTTTLIYYSFSQTNFQKNDTTLVILAAKIRANPDQNRALNGISHTITPAFNVTGQLKNGKMDGKQVILHRKVEVQETRIYQDGSLLTSKYENSQNITDSKPYSGVFFSDYAHEKIAVKDGLRHGWCVEYDHSGKEVRRTKYVKGVVKKTKSNQLLPSPVTN